jgi:AraC-like DNA-binding protein
VVRSSLEELGIRVVDVQIGSAIVEHDASLPLEAIREALRRDGFDVVEDRTTALVEQVKELIVDLVHGGGLRDMRLKLSDHIEERTQRDYRYVSTVFSQTAGITIEKYLIAQRIEKVKELLVYGEMSLADIAFELGYSSVAYLSNQFKQETGMTPTVFRKQAVQARRSIDSIGS